MSPKKIEINVAPTKNGPNGTSDFNVFVFIIIKKIETKAPRKKARNKAIKILGQPKIKPIKNTNFTSPIPIQRSLDISTKERKNKPATKAASRVFNVKNPKAATTIPK